MELGCDPVHYVGRASSNGKGGGERLVVPCPQGELRCTVVQNRDCKFTAAGDRESGLNNLTKCWIGLDLVGLGKVVRTLSEPLSLNPGLGCPYHFLYLSLSLSLTTGA